MANPFYKDYSQFLAERFGNVKVQKLSIDAGFSCPNRDGTISQGGCLYCNVKSFTPGYCDSTRSVKEQLETGRQFFARKYPKMKYLAYFQSFTGTHSRAVDILRNLYEEAAEQPDVVGLIIGTRPDCLPLQVVDLLAELNRKLPVIVEIGAETSNDETLQVINRRHAWADVENAVRTLHEVNIETGLHLIAGLPGETDDDMLASLEAALSLPVSTLKFHQLQIIRDTALEKMWKKGDISVNPYRMEDYLELCVKIVEKVRVRRPEVAIERFLSSAPRGMVVAPDWGLKNYEFVNLLHRRLRDEINIESQEVARAN